MNYRICVIGTKDTTIALAKHIAKKGETVDCIITINASTVNTEAISGYSPVQEYAKEQGIYVYEADSYGLKDEKTVHFFTENSFDIGICMGWQRLIPKYVLDRFTFGVFGFHGSCGYLPYGRGRSPLNWSIILGDERFILNMFRYDEKVDSPNVYQNRMFEINEHDTIRTLQMKNLLCSYEMVDSLLQDYQNGTVAVRTDSKDGDSLYPKRTPADGKIDFMAKTRDIYNLVRAVTRPFPGAFCYVGEDNTEIKIWDAVPFDKILDLSNYAPGEIVEIIDGKLIVRTVDGSLLIREYESKMSLSKGMLLK